MIEKICLKCRNVASGAENRTCCGKSVAFDPCEHGKLLISGANSWNMVISRWGDHPTFEAVSEDMLRGNSASAPGHLNEFIRRLLSYKEALLEPRPIKTEGLPYPEDCHPEGGWAWFATFGCDWTQDTPPEDISLDKRWNVDPDTGMFRYSHWLPYWAIPSTDTLLT
jgi:hypothetical protein